jgi:predicted alpha/beta-fold hydrolase
MTHDYTLVQVVTSDKLNLSGLYQPGDKNKTAVIAIHGFNGDFYSHTFYHDIADQLKKQGNALVLAQTRGTGIRTEFIKTDRSAKYIGSNYERIEDAHIDITAFMQFLQAEGYTDIALLGHSLGTIKIVRYLSEGELADMVSKLVLLAPFDKNAFLEDKASNRRDEFVSIAKAKIDAGQGEEIVPVPEFEDFPVSYTTFHSWYHSSELSNMWDFYRADYDFPIMRGIQVPVKALLGSEDHFVTFPKFNEDAASALACIKANIPDVETVLLKGTGHAFQGQEKIVAKEVAEFLK